ncbi:MAG: cobalt ECF transporter T component CbiQ [Sedimentisphaerales bacterium]
MHHAYIDKFAYQDSPIHRLDARVKFIVTVVFTAVVISLPRTSISILFCYAIGPFAVLALAGVPLRFAFKHILLVSPFVLVLALTSPLYDKRVAVVAFGPWTWQTTLGWLRCYSIAGKFVLTMLALISLVSTTRFADLLAGLQRLAVPRLLVIQIGFLYRYIFLLIDSAHHILRARASRSVGSVDFRTGFGFASAMLGSLFVRSVDTAERISAAMQARGFDGHWRTINRLTVRGRDYVFVAAAVCFIFGLHLFVRPVLR